MKQEEFEFELNDVAMYTEDSSLVVSFGDGRIATMELENDQEVAVVKTLLADPNLWANFLGSLSAGLKQHV